MKKITFILVLILLLSVFHAKAEDQKIQLKLKEGYEYVFEQTEKTYLKLYYGYENNRNIRYRKYSIEVEKFIDDNEIILNVKHLANKEKRFNFYGDVYTTDFLFPSFSEPDVFDDVSGKQLETLLCLFDIQFSLNLKTNEIYILHREELLEKYYEKLIERGYTERNVQSIIRYLDEKQLDLKKNLVESLLWFQNATLQSDIVKTGQLQEEYIYKEAGKKFIKFGDEDLENIIPGKWHKKYWLNTENGIITDYSSIKKDSIENFEQSISSFNAQWRVTENEIKFLSTRKVKPEVLTISGWIRKPLSDKVYIRFLDEPFGTDLKKQTVFLDEHGIFSTSFEYKHKGLVFIENENNNRHNPSIKIVLYAEPGDSLHFETHEDTMPWNIVFFGDRIVESELIQEFREQMKLKKYSSSHNNQIFDEDIYIGGTIHDKEGKRIGNLSGNIELDKIPDYLDLTDKISDRFQSSIDTDVLNYIKNETRLYLIDGLYRSIGRIETWKKISVTIDNYEEFNLSMIKKKLSEIDVSSIYHDYGLYSRKCIGSYLDYTFQSTNKVEGMGRLTGDIRSYGNYYDIEQNVQLYRMIISGSPLYREISSYLSDVITYKEPYPLEVKFYSLQTAQRYMELIVRRSADNELNEKVRLLLEQHEKILSDNYVPEINFLDTSRNTVTYKDFTGQKPTVFYFCDNWIGQRYQLDDYVKENQDVNFIMVTEGNNFREWLQYQKHAEPLATHLFFKNDSITLKELLFRTDVFIVFNRNGKLFSIEKTLKEAKNKAKASLESPKIEWDQSLLRNIILALGIILFVVILILLIVRLKAQKKLKKENQLRRLRELELTAIRSQMNPHFLFNSLNSVQYLIQNNHGKEANQYLANFAGLIRKVLNNSEKEEVPLADELELIKQYLNLEKLRFEFDFDIKVDQTIDPYSTQVPPMLIQPFVENAVIHGLQNKKVEKKVSVQIFREGKAIIIRIEDNGIGRKEAAKIKNTQNGKSTKLMKERLSILQSKYLEKYSLDITDLNEDGSGTRVIIQIPDEI